MTVKIESAVSEMLDDGYRALFDKWLFTQLALIRGVIDEQSVEYRTVDGILALLRPFSAAKIIAHATPFFWLNVLRRHLAAGKSPKELKRAVDGLSIAAADSFLRLSPQRTEYCPRVETREEGYCFPTVGYRLFLEANSRLRCTNEGMLAVDGATDRRNEQPQAVAREIPGFSGISLVLCNDALMFDDEYRDKLFPDTPNALALARMIQLSLQTIGDVSPPLLSRLNNLVRWYVPIHSPGFQLHNSFTVSTLFGVTFLSHAYDSLRLAEAIVHEFHHSELYMLMAVEDLFEDVEGEYFYSPWREDPRPLIGLLHGLHVFANVKRFLQRALSHSASAEIAADIAERSARLGWQLRIGLEQVPRERLHAGGIRIIDDIRSVAESDSEPFADPPQALLEHMDRWQQLNPGFALRVLTAH